MSSDVGPRAHPTPTAPSGGFASVVFDCDSTLTRIEGIDELAGAQRAGVQALTDAAMRGEVPLEAVYGRRLEMIRPSRDRIAALARAYIDALVDDARDVLAALLALKKAVRIVSGGLREPVEALAAALGVSGEAVAAVAVRFDEDGAFLDFDRESPLTRDVGKGEIITAWALPRPILLVGDGATDLAARAAVDCFAAFAGVVHRAAVVERADVVLRAPSLAPVLALAASPAEREWLSRSPWASLLRRGDSLLTRRGAP